MNGVLLFDGVAVVVVGATKVNGAGFGADVAGGG